MNQEINPIHFTKDLTETYRRYLYSATPISADEPEMQEAFWNQLDSFRFFGGPFIQYQPTYKRSIQFGELFDRNDPLSLHPKLKACFDLNDLKRPEYRLYTHQAEAIEKAKNGENILIATGTGSGKTECFLLPILDDAIRNPGPGVRSIIVYPMNALANDQLDRLTQMLRSFENDEVTFGRYTGETPWNDQDAEKKYPDHKKLPCERFTREEIRQNPPHILLTNFAMLEYLLIRPRDSEIFAQQRLNYIVLDEAHTYRGAQGIEVALLMRRLREAFRGCRFQFFLTSATFTSGQCGSANQELVEFAANLTGSKFKPENILFGETNNPFPATKKNESILEREKLLEALSSSKSIENWINGISDSRRFRKMLLDSGFITQENEITTDADQRLLYDMLIGSNSLKAIYHEIKEKPLRIQDIAEKLFGDDAEHHRRAVQWLLVMGSLAKPSAHSAPLVGTRMHLFFRGLNGACVCLNPNCPDKAIHPDTCWSHFSLNPLRKCPHCDDKVLPMTVCWHCGLPVLPVYIQNSHWNALQPNVQHELDKRYLTWWRGTAIDDADDEDQEHAWVCGCGYYSDVEAADCTECGKTLIKLSIIQTRDGEIKKCPRCGGESGVFDGVTRTFITADDAPTAVLTESAMRNMPIDDQSRDKPAHGRTLLAFSDSRQRAAFFAPYLRRTSCESAYQQPLLEAVRKAVQEDGAAGLQEVGEAYEGTARTHPYVVVWDNTGEENETFRIVPSAMASRNIRRQLRTNCLISLYRHFCNSPRQRNKLTGLGLCSAYVEMLPQEKEKIRNAVPFLCSDDEYFPASQLLLNIFMVRKAVHLVGSVEIRHISNVVNDAMFHRSQSQNSLTCQISRFNPYHAPNNFARTMAVSRSRQLKLICKWTGLNPQNDGQQLSEIIDKVWDSFFDGQYPDDSILVDCGNGRRKLNGERILLEIPKAWFRCDSCGYLTPISLNFKNLCPSADCNGHLQPISDKEMERAFRRNHQRRRYLSEPLPLEVKEHTAQLQLRSSQQYQEAFKKGLVNVLSCSTTFEMGVDVGALKTVMLRNIPPSPANYIQRAGRVGRRNDGVSYVVTFSRKLPHDQFYYANPDRIVSGKVDIPYLSLENDVLAQRHVNSFLLGAYLRDGCAPDFGESVKLNEFFLIPDSNTAPAAHYPEWLKQNNQQLKEAIARIIPKQSKLDFEAAFEKSFTILHSDNPDCVMEKHVKLTLADYDRQIEELKSEAETQSDNPKKLSFIYSCIANVEQYKKRFSKQRLIDFLSKVGWLPGYAFPQDVIELRVLQAEYADKMNLTRDRDIGIAEYAPGSEIIADGKVFKSKGVVGKKGSLEGMLFEPKLYQVCGECRIINQYPITASKIPKKCDCGKFYQKIRRYIIPDGFSTRIDDKAEDPKFRRLKPPPNSEVFLVEGAKPDDFVVCKEVKNASYALKKNAKLFRANLGVGRQQFRICMKCGAMIESGGGNAHKTLWGNQCSAGARQIARLDLANEVTTDVLQIRFKKPSPPPIADKVFWLSFLSSFLNGASRSLNIDPNDISGTYNRIPETGSEAELVIWDRIPGGAGYLKRISENLKKCLKEALDVVKNCNDPSCTDLESSCYGCLRSYSNQFDWDNLRRQPVIDWLTKLEL